MATRTGNNNNNRLVGTTGNDVLKGLGGMDFLWGGAGNDKLEGGDDRDMLLGGAGRDELHGGDGNDVLDGGADYDRLYGGDGNDVLVGGTGFDKLYGGAGDDVLVLADAGHAWGGSGADALIGVGSSNWRILQYGGSDAGVTVNLATGRGQGGDAEGDTISGFTGIVGSKHNDTLTGDEGDNYFRGRGGADVIDGGGGIDTASFNLPHGDVEGVTVDLGGTKDADGFITARGGVAEGERLKNIENLQGSQGDDKLTGDEKVNQLLGLGGDDVLEGRGGADTLVGYRDTASYEHSPGGSDGSGVTVNLGVLNEDGWVVGTGGDAQGDKLKGINNLRGSAHNDTLTGDSGDNVLEGGAGAWDTLDGGGGAGKDTASYEHSAGGVTVDLSATPGRDGYITITGTGGDAQGDKLKSIENLRGSAHADTLTGDGTDNVLKGLAGEDTLKGGGGNDELDGGGGADELYGDAGEDHLKGSIGSDRLFGGSESDKLEGGDDVDALFGQGGIDYLYGGDGNDVLDGGVGDDELYGDAGADRLEGHYGSDLLTGGAGADTFVFGKESVVVSDSTTELGAETDFVKDFSGLGADGVKQADEDGDKLDLSGLKEHASFTGTKLIFQGTDAFTTSADQGQVRYSHEAGNLTNADTTDDRLTHVTVDVDGDGDVDFQVTLEGETDYTLTVSDLLGVEVA